MSDEKRCSQCGAALAADAPQGLCPACLLKRGFFTSDGARTEYAPPTPAELARYFPELEILELVGRGGMGAVYKARQKNLDRLVALKILPFSVNRDPAFAERFAREARALAKLTHPNIVSVHDSGQADGLFYFIMEFVDGMNLRQLLNSGRIAPKEALAIVPQICDALQYAHDKGIVHRDIKPENILLDKTGTVKIADFGLAKLMGREAKDLSITDTHDVMGTPHYMAPEQVEHPLDVDHRADIYSLGVVFYQMLTGELPIGRFAPPSKKVVIDVRLDEVVLRALEKEPEHRYQHASDVKTQVETILTTPPQNSAGVSPGTPASPTGALSPWCHIIGIAFGNPLTSPLAIKLVNSSALGFLSFLAFLRFVPLPGMQRCSGFAGFSGFFGLIGLAYIVEAVGRRRATTPMPAILPEAPVGTGGSPVRWIARILGVLSFLIILVFILAEGFLLKTRNSTTTVPTQSTAAPTRAAAVQSFSFGPVIERVLNDPDDDVHGNFIIFESGKPIDMPVPWNIHAVSESLLNALNALGHSVDALSDASGGSLIVFQSVTVPVSNAEFDTLTPAALVTNSVLNGQEPGDKTITITNPPSTFLFKTYAGNRGSRGILQIAGFTDKPRGVIIRYKLVQTGASRATAPFIARYPGGTVELVALTSKPWTNTVCWRPDGTISKDPFPTMNGNIDQWAANMDVEKTAFRIHSENSGDISCPVVRVTKDSGVQAPSSAWQAPYPQSPDGLFLQIITCPTNAETMNISLGVANGAWETGVTLNNSASALTGASAVDDWNAAYNAVIGSQGDVAVSFIYSKSDDWETRMAYVDGDGKVIPIQENGSRIKTSQVGGTLLIWSNEFARVKEFRLQKRKYQWVEFRNVSLRPGHLTQVENVDAIQVASATAFVPPASVLAKPILRYSGTVYYPSGKPAAGVHVAFYPGFYWGSGNYAETRTDTNGRYEIIQQPKTSNIMIGPVNPTNSIMAGDVRENLAAIQFFGAGVSNVDLTLQPAITLSGSVKNTDGKPVPGAELDIRFLSGNSITSLRSQSTTVSELGLFSSPVLPQGREYWIYGIKAKGYGSAFARVEATDTKAITYSFPPFVLKPTNYRLAGRVLDSKGKPLIGTRVSFSGPGQPQDSFTNTDSEGQFFFDAVCEGPIKIFANYQDPQDTSIYMNLNGGSGMEVEAGDTNILIKLTVGTRPADEVTNHLSFGPVVERVIYDYKSGKNWLLNLETGETFSLPAGLDWEKNASAVWEWAHQHGVHIMGFTDFSQHGRDGDPVPVIQTLNHGYGMPVASKRALYGFEMKAALMQEKGLAFETITPLQISTELQKQVSPAKGSSGLGPWLSQFASMALHGTSWHGTDDYLYAFETEDGQSGVLQITGFTDNPRGVKIRYKLVRPVVK